MALLCLDNDKKVDAPNSDNEFTFNGKHILKESELNGNLGFFNNNISFYGYNPAIDTTLNKNNISQKYNGAKFNVALESLETDSTKLCYKVNGIFDFIDDKYSNNENHAGFQGQIGKQVNDFYFGAELFYDNYFRGSNNDSIHNAVLAFRPFLSKSKGDWRFLIGLDGVNDETANGSLFHTYLRANLEFAVAPSVLHAFLGYNGFLEENNLSKIAGINPFIIPGLNVKNTDHKVHLFGGFKGNINSNTHYLLQASYSEIDNQYFFINDTISKLSNQFMVVYDNIEMLNFSADFDIKASEKVTVMAKVNYYAYSMSREAKPWQLPEYDASMKLKYNLRDKILLTGELYAIGKRFARDPVTTNPIPMKAFSDFNLGIEYRYTKLLALFIQFKNLTGARYSWYNQYPVYRFQVMCGLTYLL